MDSSGETERRFCGLYRVMYPDILGYVARRIGEQEAVDAAADVFVVAWKRIDDAPDGDAARPWLFGVARNVVRNRQRASRRLWRFWERYREHHGEPPESPEVIVVRRSEGEAVLAALGRLPRSEQELLRLVAWEEIPYAEIAQVLGCSRHAVDQRVQRALHHLASAMHANGQVLGRGIAAGEERAR